MTEQTSTEQSAEDERRRQALERLGILYSPSEERFDRITRLAQRHFGVESCIISLADAETHWFKSAQGMMQREIERDISFCSHTLKNDDSIVIPDTLTDERFAESPLVTSSPYIRFYAGHAIRLDSGLKVGALSIFDSSPRDFGEDDHAALCDFAAIIEGELRISVLNRTQRSLIKQNSTLRRKTMLDAMTGAWNRTAMLELLEREMEQADDHTTTIAVIDLDHFKQINDAYGHQAGDTVLVKVASSLRSAIRGQDVLGRLGGEEFMVLLSRSERTDALLVGERIRAAVETTPVRVADHNLCLTISMGIACSTDFPGMSWEQFLEQADKAMYQAKATGRNRVVAVTVEGFVDAPAR